MSERSVVLIAGGTGGLGTPICEALAGSGRELLLTYRTRREEAERLVARLGETGARVSCIQVDLCSEADVNEAFRCAAALGPVDAVVYASGPAIPQRWFSLVSPEDWQSCVAAEVQAFFNFARAALPHLRAAEGGALVAITSAGVERVIPGDVLSAVPKAAIEALVRQIAREEGRYRIRANCVAPGIIDAGLGLKSQQDHYTNEIWDRQRRAIPLRRFGEAGAIAEAVAFLLSDKANYVTGQTIVVDGGMSV